MFGNWINIHDLGRLKEKIERGELLQVMKKLRADGPARTRAAWEHTQAPPIHAWDMPALRRRWNKLVSGDEAEDHVAFVARRFLAGRKGLKAFSPGCGGGGNEMRWAETGIFERIDACDLSAPRIAAAVAMAERKGLSAVVKFSTGDMRASDRAGTVRPGDRRGRPAPFLSHARRPAPDQGSAQARRAAGGQ